VVTTAAGRGGYGVPLAMLLRGFARQQCPSGATSVGANSTVVILAHESESACAQIGATATSATPSARLPPAPRRRARDPHSSVSSRPTESAGTAARPSTRD